jgi:hypothetical protein
MHDLSREKVKKRINLEKKESWQLLQAEQVKMAGSPFPMIAAMRVDFALKFAKIFP